MADVGDRDAGRLVQRRLEREQREHPVDAAADRSQALAPPRPHRRADEVDRCARRARFSLRSRPRLKSGASTPTNSGTRSASRRARSSPAHAEELGQVRDDLDEAAHRELLQRDTTPRSRRPPSADRRCRRTGRRGCARAPRGSAWRPARRRTPRRRRCRSVTASRPTCPAQRTMPRPGDREELDQRRQHRRTSRRRRRSSPAPPPACRFSRYSVLYARRTSRMSSAVKPRRRRPSLLVPCGLAGIARHRHVRRHVLQHDGERAEHRVRADAAELVHAAKRAQHRPVVDVDVAGDLRVVGERREVADDAVVRDVRVGEEQVAVADLRVAAVLRGARVDGHVFAEDVVVADGRGRRLAAVLAILRDLADRRELEDAVARADASCAPVTTTCGPTTVPAPMTTSAPMIEYGADRRRRRDARGGIDDRGRMDVGHGGARSRRRRPDGANAASSSASAASSPSTRRPHVEAALAVATGSMRASSSSWSPGDTCRLKRTPAMSG